MQSLFVFQHNGFKILDTTNQLRIVYDVPAVNEPAGVRQESDGLMQIPLVQNGVSSQESLVREGKNKL